LIDWSMVVGEHLGVADPVGEFRAGDRGPLGVALTQGIS
jgi:hypothetical protein